MSRNKDIGVITVMFSGRPSFLDVVSAYVSGLSSRGSSSHGGCHWSEKDFADYCDALGKWYDDGGYYEDDDYYDAQAEYCGSLGGNHSLLDAYPTEDDYGMDDYEQVFPPIVDYEGSHGKRGHRGKKKNANGKYKHVSSSKHKKGRKCNIVSIHGEPLYEDEDYGMDCYGDYSVDETLMNGYKKIYFYDDYCDKDGAIKFHSLPMFLDYCEKRGIHVSKGTVSVMKARTESHCCISKIILESEKRLVLESEESYGSMVYSAATSEDIENLSESLRL